MANIKQNFRLTVVLTKENSFTLKNARNQRYPAEIITDADYVDDLALLANLESQLHSLVKVVGSMALYVNANKTVNLF